MTDDVILQMFKKRNEQALQSTQEKYGTYCKTIAQNILVCVEDAEECVNTVLLKVWDTIPPSEPKCFRAFLGKITRNSALDVYNHKNAAKRGGGQVEIAFSEIEDILTRENNVEQALESGFFADMMNIFLSELTLLQRIIFLKRYLYFYSDSEIAKTLCISDSKVKSILFRLRRKLKSKLEEEGFL